MVELTSEIKGFMVAACLAVISSLYYYNTIPEISTAPVTTYSEKFKKITLEPDTGYIGSSLSEKGGVQVYWDSETDASGWKFSNGGYFVLNQGTILPSGKPQKIKGDFEWIPSTTAVEVWVSDANFIIRKKM